MPIIAGRTEVDPDDRDEEAAVMRDLVTRACHAPWCPDVAITADSVEPTGAVLTGRRTAEQVDHWNGDHHGVPIFVPSHRPPAVRRAYVADQVEGRPGDRHAGGHPHPLPYPSPN